jgi:anti-sigma regulatory factor (Ser/Thr protein kinase)
MEDLSLHILDIAENSINAGAHNIEISVLEDTSQDMLRIEITDDGKGMEPAVAEQIADPFYTTRTTRRVGLGLPLFNEAAKATNGLMTVQSTPGKGTKVSATFQRSHIDQKPLGDIAATIVVLVAGNPDVNFVYRRQRDDQSFTLDTAELKTKYPTLDLSAPETLTFIREYIAEHNERFS